MDPLDGVTVFVAVACCGSLSSAAEKLGCSKSTISAGLSRLEARIGARLVRRSSRSASLTEAGRAYLRQIDDILDRVQKAEKAAQAEATEPRGRIRISAPDPFASMHLAPLLPQFMARHPEVEIDLHVTAEVVDLVAEGFDLAIRLCPSTGPNVIVRKLGMTRLALVAAPELVARIGAQDALEDLANWPCLYNSAHPGRNEWHFQHQGRPMRFTIQPRFVANNHEVLHKLAVAGMGVAMLSEYAIIDDLKAGRLVRTFSNWPGIDVPVLAVYPDNRLIAAKVRVFVDFIASRLKSVPWTCEWDLTGIRDRESIASGRAKPPARGRTSGRTAAS